MDVRTIIASLIECADKLDEKCITDEADMITNIVKRLAFYSYDTNERDDFGNPTHGYEKDDEYWNQFSNPEGTKQFVQNHYSDMRSICRGIESIIQNDNASSMPMERVIEEAALYADDLHDWNINTVVNILHREGVVTGADLASIDDLEEVIYAGWDL